MKVAVCELAAELAPGSPEWDTLATSVRAGKPDLLLLNEMPFGPWVAAGNRFRAAAMEKSAALHQEGLAHLADLGCPVVMGTRPVPRSAGWMNEAFVWTAKEGFAPAHTKQYFPDEAGFYEARWFKSGERNFNIVPAGAARAGFLICTELMFNEHARSYGRRGANIIAVPRATGPGMIPQWMAALRMAAIVSGCYVLSSNRNGATGKGQKFGGHGCIVNPQGEIIATTTPEAPVAFCKIDLRATQKAQRGYPVYVSESAK